MFARHPVQKHSATAPPLADAGSHLDGHSRVVELLVSLHALDPSSTDHLWRVAHQAALVGETMGFAGDDVRVLWLAGLLHDIGKLGVPEEVLLKEGDLDPDEQEILRRHPEIGAAILEDLDGLEQAACLVLHHQERYDGRRDGRFPGYPSGLSGEEIPLGARILAVVDAFDAMVSDRPYRRGLPANQAMAELRREAGRQFDPWVVQSFLGVLAAGEAVAC